MITISQGALPLLPTSGQQYAQIQENPESTAEDDHDTHKKINTRLTNLAAAVGDDAEVSAAANVAQLELTDNPVRDTESGKESDNAPTHIVERNSWTQRQ